MKYDDLTSNLKKEIDKIINIFNIPDLVFLEEKEMGDAIEQRVNATGQDGKEFVNYVYTVTVKQNPMANISPQQYLLASFLTTLILTVFKKHGVQPDGNNSDEVNELAYEAIQMAADIAIYSEAKQQNLV